MAEVTYNRWRNEYGGPNGDQLMRLKELEAETARLRLAVSDLTLEKLNLPEAAKKNFLAPHAAGLRGSGDQGTGGLGTSGLPGSWSVSIHAAPGAHDARSRSRTGPGHHRVGPPVRPVRLSPDRQDAEDGAGRSTTSGLNASGGVRG